MFYSQLADDYYCNMNLCTEMQLPSGRDTVLSFLERFQKSYPSMRNFFQRENGDFVLEEDKEDGQQRWVSIEPRRICSGHLNPTNADDSMARFVNYRTRPHCSPSASSDCEALDYLVGFDFIYRGNHDGLVAEALGVGPSSESFVTSTAARFTNF